METTFASAFVLLLLVTDPFGNIPVVVNSLRSVPLARRPRIILREHAIALGVLLAFMFVGQGLLQLLGLHETSLRLAGGVVLLMIAIRMIFPPAAMPGHEAPEAADPTVDGEPLIVPLAIPAIAGPSALASVILLVSQAPERRLEWMGALGAAIAVGAIILLLAERIQRVLGARVVVAMERLMGLILLAVAVEMMLRSVQSLG